MDNNDHDHSKEEGLILPTGYDGIEPTDPAEVPPEEPQLEEPELEEPGEPLSVEEYSELREQVNDAMANGAGEEQAERLTEEEKAKLAEQALPEEATTVFSIVMTRDGRWIGTSRTDVSALIAYDREATFDDFIIGCGAVGSDAAQIRTLNAVAGLLNGVAQQTAAMVLGGIQQQAQAMQEQMKANQILRGVQGKGGLRGGQRG